MGLFEPHGRHCGCDGQAALTGAGRLIGIARHGRPRGPIEVIDHVNVSVEGGLDGDFRGAVKPGGRARRQVSLIGRSDWAAAMADLGLALDWSARRANLLVDGLDLPRRPGDIVCIGDEVRIQITCECDPCSRMEEIAPGLRAALTPDWRGGLLGRVLAAGHIRIGDPITIEEQA